MIRINPRAIRESDRRTASHPRLTRPASKPFPTKAVRIAVQELRKYAKVISAKTVSGHKLRVSSNRYTRVEVLTKVHELFDVLDQKDLPPKQGRKFGVEFSVRPLY